MPAQPKSRNRRARKSRTADVTLSSSSSSSSSSDEATPGVRKTNGARVKPTAPRHPPNAATTATAPTVAAARSTVADIPENSERGSLMEEEAPAPPPKRDDFDAWYLRQVTAQYANDLDKVRGAADFKDASVPMLVEALKQGARAFGEEEKKAVMSA